MSQQTVPQQHRVPKLVTDPVDARPCPTCVYHVAGGTIVAVVGFILMLTGAMAGAGIVLLILGILYAGAFWVMSLLPSKSCDADRIP